MEIDRDLFNKVVSYAGHTARCLTNYGPDAECGCGWKEVSGEVVLALLEAAEQEAQAIIAGEVDLSAPMMLPLKCNKCGHSWVGLATVSKDGDIDTVCPSCAEGGEQEATVQAEG